MTGVVEREVKPKDNRDLPKKGGNFWDFLNKKDDENDGGGY